MIEFDPFRVHKWIRSRFHLGSLVALECYWHQAMLIIFSVSFYRSFETRTCEFFLHPCVNLIQGNNCLVWGKNPVSYTFLRLLSNYEWIFMPQWKNEKMTTSAQNQFIKFLICIGIGSKRPNT